MGDFRGQIFGREKGAAERFSAEIEEDFERISVSRRRRQFFPGREGSAKGIAPKGGILGVRLRLSAYASNVGASQTLAGGVEYRGEVARGCIFWAGMVRNSPAIEGILA